MQSLLDHHYDELSAGSGISDDVIEQIGFESTDDRDLLTHYGFSGDQRRVPCLLLPMHGPSEAFPVRYQIKPDSPRVTVQGTTLKYEWPFRIPPALACPPVDIVNHAVRNPDESLYITEGLKKAASAISRGIPCLSLNGVWNWKAKDHRGRKTTIGELDVIPWEGRSVYLCFDNDVMTKEGVYSAMVRFSAQLERRNAKVRYILLPEGPNKGLDDYFVAGGTRDSLAGLASEFLPHPHSRMYTHNDLGFARRVADLHEQ